jgi:hypothetical protein
MTKAAELAKWGEVSTNGQVSGRRNLIINGAMKVAQRGTSSTSSGRQTLDRFEAVYSNFDNATQTQSQDSTAPNGFKTSHKIAIGATAESAIDANEQQYIRYKIEGQDLQQLKYGTSDAESMTLSFYVRSSVTGTFSISFFLNDTTKNHVKTYTISSANTWERKTITVSPNTSDVIDNDNGIGLSIHWFLTLGSDSLGSTEAVDTWIAHSSANFSGNVNSDFASNANATFFITGVQLEVGSVATPFEHRSYGEELALCQRYYETAGRGIMGGSYSATAWVGAWNFAVPKRASPTLTVPAVITVHDPSTATYEQSSVSIVAQYPEGTKYSGIGFLLGNFSGMTAFRPMEFYNPDKAFVIDSEL